MPVVVPFRSIENEVDVGITKEKAVVVLGEVEVLKNSKPDVVICITAFSARVPPIWNMIVEVFEAAVPSAKSPPFTYK